jgi:hypothetical protein
MKAIFEIRCIKPIVMQQNLSVITTKNKIYPVVSIWTDNAEGRVRIVFTNDNGEPHTLEINNEFFRYHFRIVTKNL